MKGYRLTLEAVALTKAGAIAQALHCLSTMITSPDAPGHTVSGTSGNAGAEIEEIPDDNTPCRDCGKPMIRVHARDFNGWACMSTALCTYKETLES